jgi:hypothetical protein
MCKKNVDHHYIYSGKKGKKSSPSGSRVIAFFLGQVVP